jgi:hypothetical protein
VSALAVVAAAAGCATAPASPAAAGSDPEPALSSVDQAAAAAAAQRRAAILEDRVTLARLSAMLGGPLPSPADDDPLGVQELGLDDTRAYAASSPALGGARTRLRATAFKARTYRLELSFQPDCPAPCSAQLLEALQGWLGPMQETVQGRARIYTRQHDTVRARYEIFDARPDLTFFVLECQPLADRAAGRPSPLPRVGEQPSLDAHPACRELPPSPTSLRPAPGQLPGANDSGRSTSTGAFSAAG